MTKTNVLSKRIIAMLLAVVMIVGFLPISIFADDDLSLPNTEEESEGAEGTEESESEDKSGGTWGSSIRFEYHDGIITVLLPANEIARILSTRSLTKDDILGLIPRAIKDKYDEVGLIGMLLSDTMAEVVDIAELVSYFPEELFDVFITDRVVKELKVIFAIRSEEDLESDDPTVDRFTPEIISHFHIQDIFINDLRADELSQYINLDYVTSHLEDSIVNSVIANMTEEALAEMIEKADINSEDFSILMAEHPNLINDLMVVLMKKAKNDISKYLDLTAVNVQEKFKELGLGEIISQLTVEQLKSVLNFGLTGKEYETLMANIDIEKLLVAMEEDGVDFSSLLNTAIFSEKVPGDAATALLNKIMNAGSDTLLSLLKLNTLNKDQFSKLPVAAIFNALTAEEKVALFDGIDASTLAGLIDELSDADKKAIIEATIDADDIAAYLDDAFIDELYADGLLTINCQWLDVEGATSAYSEGKTFDELFAFLQKSELEQIKELVLFLSAKGTLAGYIDFPKVADDTALIEKIIPKMAGNVSVDLVLEYFDTADLLNIVWNDSAKKDALITAAVAHVKDVPMVDFYNAVKELGYETLIDIKKSVKFIIENFGMSDILENYVIEDNLVGAISGCLFAKDGKGNYKVISPEAFIDLDISYEHYIDVVALINLIFGNNFTVGGETVDAQYVIEKFGVEIIKIHEVAKYLFEKDGDEYVVISPKELIDTMNYKDSFMTALLELIIDQISDGKLEPSAIVEAYSDVLSIVVRINEVIKLLPKYIFKYLTDEDKEYFSDEDNVDRSTFIEVAVRFLIQFITGSDNIRVNTVFNSEDNEKFADFTLDGTETEEERKKYLDSFILLGKTRLHTGEHGEDTMPILSEETIPMYEGYNTAFVSLENLYKALIDCMPDMSVFTNVPEDGTLGGLNFHFDYRQWMDDFYFDDEGEDPTYTIDIEAWEAAKKEIDFGIRIGLYEEDPEATYGPYELTAINYIEEYIQRRIDEGNNYNIFFEKEDDTRLIDVNLYFVKKFNKIITKLLSTKKIEDSVKRAFVNAINGTVGEFTYYLRYELTYDEICRIIKNVNNSALNFAGDFIRSYEDKIDIIREALLSFLEGLPQATKNKKFIEHFYYGNGWFAADSNRVVSTDKLVSKLYGNNDIVDSFLEIINVGDSVGLKMDFDVVFENLYQIKFVDKNGTLKVAYLPGGTQISLLTSFMDDLSDDCKWYVKDENGNYTELTVMPEADTVVYKAYTVRFYEEDGVTLIGERDFIHGATELLDYPPVVPDKAGSKAGKWVYTLGDSSTTAYPEYIDNEYYVLWIADGKEFNSGVLYNQTPVFPYGTPVKKPDAQYSYTFVGWNTNADGTGLTPEQIVFPDEFTTFTFYALFESDVNKYTVTWANYDGKVLETDADIEYGSTVAYDGETPVRPADAQYTYTFSGWTPAVSTVTGDITYTATFSTTVNKYKVTWVGADDKEIYSEAVEYGAIPAYTGETPTKPATAQYTYTFAGWDIDILPVTEDITYTATFSETVNKYTVTWVGADGKEIYSEEVEYGVIPEFTGATPTKAEDDKYIYTFEGWDPAETAVTGNATYTATFSATEKGTANKVIFIVDGKETEVTFEDGEDPFEQAPTITEKTGYDWKWDEQTNENGDKVYVLKYEPKTYEVIFVGNDGTQTIVYYPYDTDSIKDKEPDLPEMFGYDVSWEKYTLNDDPSIEVKLVYTPKTFSVVFDFDDRTEVVEYLFGATSITEPEIPGRFLFSSAWEEYELNKAESVKVQIIYTLNLWWLIILLSIIAIVEIVIIVMKKFKKDDNEGDDGQKKVKTGGFAFLGGSIVRIIPSFGIIACIILGVVVLALAAVCIIVFIKSSRKVDHVRWEEKKDETKGSTEESK